MQFIKVNELDKSLIKELDLSSYIMLSNYYREYYQEKFSEESFVILDQGMALVVVFCSVLDKEFTLPDGACQINFVRHLPEKVEKKVIKSMGEKCKVSIRNIRREANDELKNLLKSKEISEDDEKKFEKIVQTFTDNHIKTIDQKVEIKEKEIMTI